MKKISLLFFLSFSVLVAQQNENNEVSKTLDAWHNAAATADFDAYFGLMTKDAVFIGTDATENWQRIAFIAYAKPHFDKGKAWSFTAVERNMYLHKAKDVAWFDELLDTQMGICRGSGVLRKEDNKWKVAHYVLSIAVPNEHVSDLVTLKSEKDSVTLRNLKIK